jgi:uncharacterized membrane protein YphA (DoxX/SURF4 family)
MAYSDLRLRKTLALIRIFTGILFLSAGIHKISSWEFAKIEFPDFVWGAIHGGAASFYADFLSNVVAQHPSRWAALVASTELFMGIGLVLGLAVRPVSVVGMSYTVNLMLATWNVAGANDGPWRYADNPSHLVLTFFLFLLFGIGHAGESWGVGSLYHRRRRPRLERDAISGELPASSMRGVASYSRAYAGESEFDPESTSDSGNYGMKM